MRFGLLVVFFLLIPCIGVKSEIRRVRELEPFLPGCRLVSLLNDNGFELFPDLGLKKALHKRTNRRPVPMRQSFPRFPGS